MKKTFLTITMMASLSLTSAFAAEVHNRKVEQQERIAQGVASGSLTPRETVKLEKQEGHLNREIARDRAAHDGHLTARERYRINRQQNHLSREIYRDKHN